MSAREWAGVLVGAADAAKLLQQELRGFRRSYESVCLRTRCIE